MQTSSTSYSDSAPLVVALGGNALTPAADDPRHYPDLPPAAAALARQAGQPLLVTHGNGPQIGALAQAYSEPGEQALDRLGAETEGFLGYLIEQELCNHLAGECSVATLMTRVRVEADDPAFDEPTKPIGAWLSAAEKERLAGQTDWRFIEREGQYRRVVASPTPRHVVQRDIIAGLLAAGTAVICAGGGGVPVIRDARGRMTGVDAVIDKDFASALLACQLEARQLVLATNVDAVYRDWEGERQQPIRDTTVDELEAMALDDGSMGPKVAAACRFVRTMGRPAVIGALAELEGLLEKRTGTVVWPEQ